MPEPKSATLTIRIPKEAVSRLQAEADRQGVPRNALIWRYIEHGYNARHVPTLAVPMASIKPKVAKASLPDSVQVGPRSPSPGALLKTNRWKAAR